MESYPPNWLDYCIGLGVLGIGILIIVCLLMIRSFVSKMMAKWDQHLTRQERLAASQYTLCSMVHRSGGTANNTQLYEAGREAADILQEMAYGISTDCGNRVKPKTESMREKLHYTPPPIAMGEMG